MASQPYLETQVFADSTHVDDIGLQTLPVATKTMPARDGVILGTQVFGGKICPRLVGADEEHLVSCTAVPHFAPMLLKSGSQSPRGDVDGAAITPYTPGKIFLKSAQIGPTPFLADPEVSSDISTADTADRAATEGVSSPSSDCASAQTSTFRAAALGIQLPYYPNAQQPAFLKESEGMHVDVKEEWIAELSPFPTIGSQSHHLGTCKPCAFVFKGGCINGVACNFCHLCARDEKKRRKKERLLNRRIYSELTKLRNREGLRV